MILRDSLQLVHEEFLYEVNIRGTIKSIASYPHRMLKNKIVKGWGNVKKSLDTDEKKENFLNFLQSLFRRKFKSLDEIDSMLGSLNEDITLQDLQEFIMSNIGTILAIATVMLDVGVKIAEGGNIYVSLLYVIIGLAVVILNNKKEMSDFFNSAPGRIREYISKKMGTTKVVPENI
jgi:hypothetical protein